MSLSKKALLLAPVAFLFLVAVLFVVTRRLMLHSFADLEQKQTERSMELVLSALQDEEADFTVTANDYAFWDRMYAFMLHPSQTAIQSEFPDDTLAGLQINYVLVFDLSGKVVFARGLDLAQRLEIDVPQGFEQSLKSNDWFWRTSRVNTSASGLLLFHGRPILVAACPILNSERKGPARGVLVMAREFDRDELRHLMNVTRSSLSLDTMAKLNAPSLRPVRATLERNPVGVAILAKSDNQISGFASLRDISGKPQFIMQMDMSRALYQEGLTSVRYYFAGLCAVSLAFGLVLFILLQRAVLSRLARLSSDVNRIAERKTLSERVYAAGEDELSQLARGINRMLDALEQTDVQFRQLSENIQQVFWVKDPATQDILYISKAFESVWGRSWESLRKNHISWQEAVYEPDRGIIAEMIRKQGEGKSFGTEYRIVRPDGEIRWIWDRCFCVSSEEGKITRIVGIAEDVTDTKRTEEALLRSRAELELHVQERTAELAEANQALRAQVAERALAEHALKERARLATLGAEVGAALTRASTLEAGLRQSVEALVRHGGTSSAQIWTWTENASLSELKASAGIQMQYDGEFGRPSMMGAKIEKIAETGQPYSSNDLQNDSRTDDCEWATREGLTAFAGFPLSTENRAFGVVTAYAKKPITKATLESFGAVAVQVSQFIQRIRMEEELRTGEDRFRQLFATIPVPVWLYSLETLKFLIVNDAAVEHYGYSREEFLRMTVEEIRPPEERERLLKYLQGSQFEKSVTSQWKHRTKDGRVIEVEVNSHVIVFGGKKAALVAVRDITERKRMEVELRHAQKLEAVGGLAAGIAHEINTPIQFVGDNTRFLQDAFRELRTLLDEYERLFEAVSQQKSGAELLESIQEAKKRIEVEYLKEEIPKALTQTLDGVMRVATIVRAMKEFSHVNQTVEKSTADLNRALESTLTVARNELKYVADVETAFGELPPVVCHLGDLNQVFLNLLVNAAHAIGDVVKGTERKGVIRVETSQEADWVCVAIRDTGSGIPEEIRGKIFDPFFTTKEVGKGSGQGLALARAIVVEKHGGTLTFETELGKGTTFYVRLPVNGVPARQEVEVV
jgi:PAS domain S-box-containing protein